MIRRRQVLSAAGACLLAGCAPRPGPETLVPRRPDPGSTRVRIHVATSRRPYAQASLGFSSRLSARLSLRDYDLAVPADPRALPAVVGVRDTDLRSLGSGLSRSARTVVFVHGYNKSYQQSLFDAARLHVSSTIPDDVILFAWPSAGRTVDYVADRDAALGSRDDLAQLLDALAARRSDILLVGHSMGAWLTMEALRTLRAAGRSRTLSRIETVLAAPDIDVALFDEQLRDSEPFARPLTVLVSPDDRALAASARIGNGTVRLGAMSVTDPQAARLARRADIRLVDISALPAQGFRHDRYEQLARHMGELERSEPSSFTRAGAYVLDVVTGGLKP